MRGIQNCHIHEYGHTILWPRCGSETKERYKAAAGPLGGKQKKKSITRKWLNTPAPTVEDWYGIILEIYKMENLTYSLRIQKDQFYQIWNKWIEFTSPVRADFV